MFRKLQRPISKLALFLLLTFLMAGIYDVIWTLRPDYFRLQAGLNLLPLELERISKAYSAYSDKKPVPPFPEDGAEQTAAKKIESVYRLFQASSVKLTSDAADLAAKERQDKSEYQTFQDAQWAQYDQFIIEKTTPASARAAAIKSRMDDILSAFGAKSQDALPSGPTAIGYAQLGIEFAQAEADRARAEYEARDYGLRHLTEFQQKPTQHDYLVKMKALEALRARVSAEQIATDRLHSDLYQAFVDYRDASASRLNYGDFLYFSVGAATTATFGDIAPNSTLVRMLVCLQVLISIGFTGVVVSELVASRDARIPNEQTPIT